MTQTISGGTFAFRLSANGILGTYDVPYGNDLDFTFTNTPAIIYVTPLLGQSKVFGDGDRALSFTYTGNLAPGDAFSGGLVRVAGQNAGQYLISLGNLSLSSPNFSVALAPGSTFFTIDRLPVSILPTQGQGKLFGDEDPALFAYTLSQGKLIGTDTLTGFLARQPGETAGTYGYLLGTLTASRNYLLGLSDIPSVFTITTSTQPGTPNTPNPTIKFDTTAFDATWGRNNTEDLFFNQQEADTQENKEKYKISHEGNPQDVPGSMLHMSSPGSGE